jgi:hypothetical protein
MKMLTLPPQRSEIKQVSTTLNFTSVCLKEVPVREALRHSKKNEGTALNSHGLTATLVSDKFKTLIFRII